MQDFIMMHYPWFRALHLIAVISWMAGLLYLPRLFVYHAEAKAGGELSETLKTMERRLLRYIMNPAMIAAWLFGSLMLYANTALFSQGWMHVKLTMIILMTVFHYVLARWRKTFLEDANKKPARFYRYSNEIPTILMIIIVIMVLAQPV